MDAGNNIEVKCNVKLPNISVNNIEVQTYYGRIQENGVVDDISIIPMKLIEKDEKKNYCKYSCNVDGWINVGWMWSKRWEKTSIQ